jgi:hypothetical protein
MHFEDKVKKRHKSKDRTKSNRSLVSWELWAELGVTMAEKPFLDVFPVAVGES